MKKTIYISTILSLFLFPIYGNCQEEIAIFFDEFAFEDKDLKNDADRAQSKLRTKFINDPKINNCDNLEIVTLENIFGAKDVSEDHKDIWENKLDIKNNLRFAPKGTNVLVLGKIKSDRDNHSIEVEVYDLRNPDNSRKISHSIVDDEYNFFQDNGKLEAKISSLYTKIFGENFYKKLNISCSLPEAEVLPESTEETHPFRARNITFRVGGSALSLGLIYMGIQRMRAFKSLDDCLSFLPNQVGCELYYDVYTKKTNPEDPIYPYSFKEEGLSRDEVYKAANTRFKIDQILFYGFGTLGLLYTWKDFIPGWKKANFWHPFAASNLKLSTDPIPQIGFDTYGIGHWGGWGISVNKKF